MCAHHDIVCADYYYVFVLRQVSGMFVPLSCSLLSLCYFVFFSSGMLHNRVKNMY